MAVPMRRYTAREKRKKKEEKKLTIQNPPMKFVSLSCAPRQMAKYKCDGFDPTTQPPPSVYDRVLEKTSPEMFCMIKQVLKVLILTPLYLTFSLVPSAPLFGVYLFKGVSSRRGDWPSGKALGW